MAQETITSAAVPDANGVPEGVPLPKRNGSRGMLPLSWMGRKLRIEYTDAGGGGQEASGVLLDWCPAGPVLNVRGARTIIAWDRLAVVELAAEGHRGG
jgi:hypothetical protein